jgi:hypothetical protein
MIGRLERVELREVWRHEAQDFTRWLVENPDVIEDVIGLSLVNLTPEQAAGAFRVDITGEARDGSLVVIENQLGPSDHDHLGKLVTYVAARSASIAVWIVADPRPEHIRAITWLNEGGTARFYLLKVQAVRIGESDPAPLLTLITGPSEGVIVVGEDKKKELAARHYEREEFWTSLLRLAKARSRLFSAVSPSRDSWISAGAGRSGLAYVFRARQHDSAVEFSIERASAEENAAAFESLQAHRAEVEAAFGDTLECQQRSGRRGSFWVGRNLELGRYRDPERWPELHEAMVDAMVRLDRAVRPHLDKLGLSG